MIAQRAIGLNPIAPSLTGATILLIMRRAYPPAPNDRTENQMQHLTRRDLILALGVVALACREAPPPGDGPPAAEDTAVVTLAVEGMV